MNLNLDEFAAYVFNKHCDSTAINVQISDGIDTAKDMFCFCLDLLCKGIVLMFGGTEGSVRIDSITMEQFGELKKKMKLVGIDCDLAVSGPYDPPLTVVDMASKMGTFYSQPDDMNIEDYTFEIVSNNMVYSVKFRLIRNT